MMDYVEICLLIRDLMIRIINNNCIEECDKNIILDIFDLIKNTEFQNTDTCMIFFSSLIHLFDLLYDNKDDKFNKELINIKMSIIDYIYNRQYFYNKKYEPIFSQTFTNAFNF